ncbi:MAG: DUF2798 domain-containing protein [Bacilli bacterium]|nr:DUF2798 domain-containing protein [Bacilli bacterium]
MPVTKKESIIFSIIMVICMVFVMTFYNISLQTGLSYNNFIITLYSLPITFLIAWCIEYFFVEKKVHSLASEIIDFKTTDKILIIIVISTLTVIFMCPLMSLIAVLLHNHNNIVNIPLIFIKTFVFNLPVALLSQLLYIGPFVRFVFKKIKKYI